jgi:hypothetical protein
MACNDRTDKNSNVLNTDSLLSSKAKEKAAPVNIDTIPVFTDLDFIKPKAVKPSGKLQQCVNGPIQSVSEVDFTGDGIPDFICKMKADTSGVGIEYWISSDYKRIKTTQHYSEGFCYRWFINLDADPEPEIFKATGDEDGADYTFEDQNLQTGLDTILLYINPVIIENNKKYWGYPWDITNLKASTNGKIVKLFCSLNHKIERSGNEETDPEKQKQMPVIFFKGHSTEKSEVDKINQEQWLSLSELIEQTKR